MDVHSEFSICLIYMYNCCFHRRVKQVYLLYGIESSQIFFLGVSSCKFFFCTGLNLLNFFFLVFPHVSKYLLSLCFIFLSFSMVGGDFNEIVSHERI